MSEHIIGVFSAFLLSLSILVVPSYSQNGKLNVDGQRAKSYVEWMSRDKLEGRKTLTRGYCKAAEWAAASFKQWGLDPAGDDGTYFQQVPIKRKFTHMTGMPAFRIGKQLYLMKEEDFSVHASSTAATSVNAEVVFTGYGISAQDKGLDEYADVNVRDKIVLALKGSPHGLSTNRDENNSLQKQSSDPWEHYVSDEVKIMTAYERGAAAILLHSIQPVDEQKSKQSEQGSEEKEKRKFEWNFLSVYDQRSGLSGHYEN